MFEREKAVSWSEPLTRWRSHLPRPPIPPPCKPANPPGCYPLAAVTMEVAVLGQRVVSVLAGGLVGRQGLRAGSVDSASHERLLEVALVRPAASRPARSGACVLRSAASSPDAGQLLRGGKAIGSAHCCFNPSPFLSLPHTL